MFSAFLAPVVMLCLDCVACNNLLFILFDSNTLLLTVFAIVRSSLAAISHQQLVSFVFHVLLVFASNDFVLPLQPPDCKIIIYDFIFINVSMKNLLDISQ
jgi:hypothetical protein